MEHGERAEGFGKEATCVTLKPQGHLPVFYKGMRLLSLAPCHSGHGSGGYKSQGCSYSVLGAQSGYARVGE